MDWVDVPLDHADDWEEVPVGPSSAESAGRGFAQGSTFGFSDEGGAGFYSALEKLLPETVKTAISGRNPNLDYSQVPEKSLGETYKEYRDTDRQKNAAAKEANPGLYTAGEIGGGVLTSSLAPMGLASTTLQGTAAGLGYSNADNIQDMAIDSAKGAGLGLAAGGAAKGLGYAAPKVMSGVSALGDKLKGAAEKLAVNATGATGKQSANFADDAGRELLDRNLVKVFDTPEKIAARVGQASDDASIQIENALRGLDSKGAAASVDDIAKGLEEKIASLADDPSQAPLARKLQSIVDDIYNSGKSSVPLSNAEATKRGFGQKIRNWQDPELGAANKAAYRGYMGEVEKKALDVDPALAGQFKEGKKLFGLLDPIEEAASKRAATLNQSPFGGLGDVAATAVAGGNPLGAVARRAIAPRLGSTGAVGLDKLGDILKASPQAFGKYAGVLQQASMRGSNGLAATNFLLQQTDPEYRMILNQVAEKGTQGSDDDGDVGH
jgi:hypothetical protein